MSSYLFILRKSSLFLLSWYQSEDCPFTLNGYYSIFRLKGSCSLNRKIGFSISQNLWLMQINEATENNLTVESQTADSGIRLAAIVLAILTSLWLSANFRYEPIEVAYCRYKSKNQFLLGNSGKVLAMHVNGLFAISFLQQEPYGYVCISNISLS
jgi:hypothetical protein